MSGTISVEEIRKKLSSTLKTYGETLQKIIEAEDKKRELEEKLETKKKEYEIISKTVEGQIDKYTKIYKLDKIQDEINQIEPKIKTIEKEIKEKNQEKEELNANVKLLDDTKTEIEKKGEEYKELEQYGGSNISPLLQSLKENMEERYRLLLDNLEETKKEYNDIYVKVEKLKKIKAILEQKIGDKSITQQDLDKINYDLKAQQNLLNEKTIERDRQIAQIAEITDEYESNDKLLLEIAKKKGEKAQIENDIVIIKTSLSNKYELPYDKDYDITSEKIIDESEISLDFLPSDSKYIGKNEASEFPIIQVMFKKLNGKEGTITFESVEGELLEKKLIHTSDGWRFVMEEDTKNEFKQIHIEYGLVFWSNTLLFYLNKPDTDTNYFYLNQFFVKSNYDLEDQKKIIEKLEKIKIQYPNLLEIDEKTQEELNKIKDIKGGKKRRKTKKKTSRKKKSIKNKRKTSRRVRKSRKKTIIKRKNSRKNKRKTSRKTSRKVRKSRKKTSRKRKLSKKSKRKSKVNKRKKSVGIKKIKK